VSMSLTGCLCLIRACIVPLCMPYMYAIFYAVHLIREHVLDGLVVAAVAKFEFVCLAARRPRHELKERERERTRARERAR
jgi:hypothetical protein